MQTTTEGWGSLPSVDKAEGQVFYPRQTAPRAGGVWVRSGAAGRHEWYVRIHMYTLTHTHTNVRACAPFEEGILHSGIGGLVVGLGVRLFPSVSCFQVLRGLETFSPVALACLAHSRGTHAPTHGNSIIDHH